MTICPRPLSPLATGLIRTFLFTSILLAAPSCKKKKAFDSETAQSTVQLRTVMGELDEVLKDVNTVIMEQYTLRGRVSSQTATTSICGAALDTLGMVTGKVTISYDGTDCYGKKRNGKVIFQIEKFPQLRWKNKDCKIQIDFKDYEVTRVSDGRVLRFEGSQTLLNESGNTWFDVWYLGAKQVQYRQQATDLKITFSGSRTAFFSVDRKLTYTHSSGLTTCVVEGMGSHNQRNSVEAWGHSLDNENFAAEVTSPYVWHTNCGPIAPVSGEVSVVIEGKEFDLKCRYGVDNSGNSVSGGQCPFGWEVTWSRKKRTNARLFGYY